MRLTAFISFTVSHLVLSAVFGVLGFAVAMAAVDGEASIFAVGVVLVAWRVLFFPIIALSAVVDIRGASAGAAVALFLGNSIVWAALAAMLWSWCQRRWQRVHGAPHGVLLERRGAV